MPRYNLRFLRYARRQRPDLWARLRLHFTGEPPPCLDGVRAVVFWVGDPLREMYPEEYRECAAVAVRARQCGIPLVNPPESLSNTRKGTMGRIWRDAGLPTPGCWSFGDRRSFEGAVRQLAFPAVVRGESCHAQEGLRMFADREEALACPDEELPYPGVLSGFVDTREGWRRRDPQALPARYFHKKRVLVYGDRVVCRNWYLSPEPIVGHPKQSLFGPGFQRPGPAGRLFGPCPLVREAVELERRWIELGPEDADLFRTAVRVLGLGFAALDYATPGPGRIVLWEANPYPYLPPPDQATLSGPRRLEAEERRHHEAMAAWLSELAGMEAAEAGRPSGGPPGSARRARLALRPDSRNPRGIPARGARHHGMSTTMQEIEIK